MGTTQITLHVDDLVSWLRGRRWLAQNGYMPKAHAVFCDPPYGIAFMNRQWDNMDAHEFQAWVTEWATLLLDFVHPGAVGAFFGGTRTFHRLASGLEDAGWEIFDTVAWMYGSGFPKSHAVGKNGAGKHWSGYGTALKPSYEPLILARAPRDSYTYAALAREFGTGALNIDGGRIGTADDMNPRDFDDTRRRSPKFNGVYNGGKSGEYRSRTGSVPPGRWPANTILGCTCESDDHTPECPVAALDAQSGESSSSFHANDADELHLGVAEGYHRPNASMYTHTKAGQIRTYNGSGGASRFYYIAKAAAWERNAGLHQRNQHPTVKPIALTEYIARLLLPPALAGPRTLLVPFSGSGSEIIGAQLAGWDVVAGIEQSADYAQIARERLAWWAQFDSYEKAKSAADADRREREERARAKAEHGVEQLVLI